MLLNILLIFLDSGFLSTFLGYWIHRALHQSWAGWFHTAHMNHHQVQYPPLDFLSEKYRSAGKHSTVLLFLIAFSPLIIGVLALGFLGFLPLYLVLAINGSLAFWGLMHDYWHDEFHLSKTRYSNIALFRRDQDLHFIHHLDIGKNYGIIWFAWDHLFGTFSPHTNLTQE